MVFPLKGKWQLPRRSPMTMITKEVNNMGPVLPPSKATVKRVGSVILGQLSFLSFM